jgi:hypothetical protein
LFTAKEGEKGVKGVPGPLVPPEVRLKIWRWDVGAGDWSEEEPDLRDAFDWEVDKDGFDPLDALSLREKSPIAAQAALRCRQDCWSAGGGCQR